MMKSPANFLKFAGYIHIETDERLEKLRAVCRPLEVYINHFLPSMKCVKKIRYNINHSSRKYDVPKTPYQRLMEHAKIPAGVKAKLKNFHETLNPKTLHDEILPARRELFRGAKFTKSDII
ncbi:MAG TPA: hypothetical protein VJB69_03185 [Candidatus Paceibacterota bacterium]